MIPIGTRVRLSEWGKFESGSGPSNPHNGIGTVVNSFPGGYIKYKVDWITGRNYYSGDEIEPVASIKLEDLI